MRNTVSCDFMEQGIGMHRAGSGALQGPVPEQSCLRIPVLASVAVSGFRTSGFDEVSCVAPVATVLRSLVSKDVRP